MLETTSYLITFVESSTPAIWGYLDPGTGSMALQILLAGMLSSAFFVKSWIRHIRDRVLLKNKQA